MLSSTEYAHMWVGVGAHDDNINHPISSSNNGNFSCRDIQYSEIEAIRDDDEDMDMENGDVEDAKEDDKCTY